MFQTVGRALPANLVKNSFLKVIQEVDGRDLSPYSQIPTYYPTQRLRGNPITLKQHIL